MRTLAVGDHAPAFELPDQDGTPTRLSELLAAGPVVLFFYPAAMTGGCTREGIDTAGVIREVVASELGFATHADTALVALRGMSHG